MALKKKLNMKMLFRGCVDAAVISCLFLLAACGGDSSGSKGTEPAEVADIMADSFNDLPVCTVKHKGAVAYVKDEKKAYICIDGDWFSDDDEISSSGMKDYEESSSSQEKVKSSSSVKDESLSSGIPSSDSESSSSQKVAVSSSTEGRGSSSSVNTASSSSVLSSSWSSEGTILSSSSSAKSSSSVKVASSSSIPSSSSRNVVVGSLTDSRDGKTYRTVTIGSQTWMAENLNYESTNSYCYNDKASNCAKYGRLYTWAGAVDSVGTWSTASKGCGYGMTCLLTNLVRGICPEGWHLPTETEWYTLVNAVGGISQAGPKLRAQTDWKVYSGITNEDAFSFTVLPSGIMNFNDFVYMRECSNFWSSTEYNSNTVRVLFFYHDDDYVRLANGGKFNGVSVRCLKDDSSFVSFHRIPSSSPKNVVVGSMTDSRDGQTYKTVTIRSQTWMAENLNYESTNSYCYNDKASNCTKYGRLYTWAAAMDSVGTWSTNGKGCGYETTCSKTYPVRGICPEGWHLPTKFEWDSLNTVVGGFSGPSLRSTSGWYNNRNGTDEFKFSALPAGGRDYYGNYGSEGHNAYFWSSTEFFDDSYNVYLNYDNTEAKLYAHGRYSAFSVRCLKDEP